MIVMRGFMIRCVWIAGVLLAGCRPDGAADGCGPPGAGPVMARESNMKKKVMPSPLAGRWFAADAAGLKAEIDRLRPQTPPRVAGVCAVIVPHAGYRFSGQVALQAYARLIPDDFDRVVILAPSHYVELRNQVSVPDAQRLATPLGEVDVDEAFVAALRKHPAVVSEAQAHLREHSDQIQIPLLQSVLGERVRVATLVVGQFDPRAAREFAAFLKTLLDERTLVVVSSDFTHYGPNYGYTPFKGAHVGKKIADLDRSVFDKLVRRDLEGFVDILDETGATVCGRNPLMILLAMLPADARVEEVAYDTSGRILDDWENSVSYLSALVKGNWRTGRAAAPAAAAALSPADCLSLLKLARISLSQALRTGEAPAIEATGIALTPSLRQVMGGFVTLTQNGHLRGCIGEIFPRREFWRVVLEQAVNAGLHDPRFDAVTADELDGLAIEISALTPPRPVASYREIVIGRHGIVLNKNGRSAVFLPQVATEQGWDLPTTLGHLAIKAGLRSDAWREGAEFLVFEAQVFHENQK